MARSQRPRRAYNADRAIRGREAQLQRMAASTVETGIAAPDPAVVNARRAFGRGGRAALLLGGTAAVGGGVAYGLHRRRAQGVSKMIDPTTGEPFGKSMTALPTKVRHIKAAVATGGHISHANDLSVTRHAASPRDGRLRVIHKAYDDTAALHVRGRGIGATAMRDMAHGQSHLPAQSMLTAVRRTSKFQSEGAHGRRIK